MKILTVIMADFGAFSCAQEPVQHRTIHIALTSEQLKQLQPHYTHTTGGEKHYESISHCFIEEIFNNG